MEDLLTFLLVFGASSLLCAIAVGFSGFAAWVKGILIFVLLIQAPLLIGSLAMSAMGQSIELWSEWYYFPITVWDGLILALMGLVLGADSIAPEAQNFAWIKRVLALLLWVPLLLIPESDSEWFYFQIFLATLAWAYVVMEGLSRPANYLNSHHTPLRRLGRWLGSCFYPAWPSAVRYVGLSMLILGGTLAFLLRDETWNSWLKALVLGASLAATILFPCVIFVLLRWNSKHRLLIHFIFQILIAVGALFLGILSSISALSLIRHVLILFPLPAFYLIEHNKFRNWELLPAVALTSLLWLATFLLILHKAARPYWAKALGRVWRAETVSPPDLPKP
ncbi:MAG: DUF3290 domain-containing protein [Blastochloris sp.]|nr:DUF3290 domain-containing protein [Blastochloris sp.]